jgi:hypothetical protein
MASSVTGTSGEPADTVMGNRTAPLPAGWSFLCRRSGKRGYEVVVTPDRGSGRELSAN